MAIFQEVHPFVPFMCAQDMWNTLTVYFFFLKFDLIIHLESMMLIRFWWLKVKVTVRNALKEFLPNRYKGPHGLEDNLV